LTRHRSKRKKKKEKRKMTGNTSFELCTESLGFESSDCSVGEGEEELDLLPSTPRNEVKVENMFQQNKDKGRGEGRVERKKQKSFPPPLRWMSTQAGKQSSYMKSERKDGRLILTEIRIERPEVFQVSTGNSNS
jgi:Fantastic Four meristem regulator